MNEQQLLRAVGDAKPEYLAQSEETKKAAQPWKRWTALAACACLIVGLGAAAFAFVTRGASSTPEASPGSAVSGNSAADGAAADPSVFLAYAGPVMPLTLREEAPELSASRRLTVDFAPYAPETGADGSEAKAVKPKEVNRVFDKPYLILNTYWVHMVDNATALTVLGR